MHYVCRELYPREERESVVSAVSGMTTFSQSFGCGDNTLITFLCHIFLLCKPRKFFGAILGGFLTYATDFLTAVLVSCGHK